MKPTRKISKNFVSADAPRKKFCPICIVRNEEIVMRKHEVSKTMVCMNCGYDTPLNMEPVIDTTLEAGNQVDTSIPYLKTVSFPKERKTNRIVDKYNSAMDAWQSESEA